MCSSSPRSSPTTRGRRAERGGDAPGDARTVIDGQIWRRLEEEQIGVESPVARAPERVARVAVVPSELAGDDLGDARAVDDVELGLPEPRAGRCAGRSRSRPTGQAGELTSLSACTRGHELKATTERRPARYRPTPEGGPFHGGLGAAEKAWLSEADARTRTGDPFITSEVLYQLSYVGSGCSV